MFDIRVAIMGAGLSGLAAAITLEKYGIEPVIFDDRAKIGDRFKNGEIMLEVMQKPHADAIRHLAEQREIYLQPTGNIKQLTIYSEKEKAIVCGRLGFTNIRGDSPLSYESQLAKQVKSKINFNSKHTYEQLLRDFTHVILATGDAAHAAKIQPVQEDLTVTIKGAMVKGKFDRFGVATWLDNRLAPKGYSYFIPISDTEGNISIAYPEYPETTGEDVKSLWNRFYDRACQYLGQNLQITSEFQITRYIIGQSQYPRIGNTFFAGNCLNAVMPFLGFGQYVALESGIFAAKDICGLGSYEEMVKPLRASYSYSLTLRRAMEQMDNPKLDYLVRKLDGYWGKKIFNSKRVDILKTAAILLRPIEQFASRKV